LPLPSQNVKEIGSGLNDNRPKLQKIFEEKVATKLVVEHKDRLTRFGINFVKQICDNFNCELIIINRFFTSQKCGNLTKLSHDSNPFSLF
jgi:predicted site-specific integrase-resolvase